MVFLCRYFAATLRTASKFRHVTCLFSPLATTPSLLRRQPARLAERRKTRAGVIFDWSGSLGGRSRPHSEPTSLTGTTDKVSDLTNEQGKAVGLSAQHAWLRATIALLQSNGNGLQVLCVRIVRRPLCIDLSDWLLPLVEDCALPAASLGFLFGTYCFARSCAPAFSFSHLAPAPPDTQVYLV